MDIKQIRRSNMLTLIEREKTRAAFARKVDPAYVSQILSEKTKAEVGNDLRGVKHLPPHRKIDDPPRTTPARRVRAFFRPGKKYLAKHY